MKGQATVASKRGTVVLEVVVRPEGGVVGKFVTPPEFPVVTAAVVSLVE